MLIEAECKREQSGKSVGKDTNLGAGKCVCVLSNFNRRKPWPFYPRCKAGRKIIKAQSTDIKRATEGLLTY